jgi:hypothetical protein
MRGTKATATLLNELDNFVDEDLLREAEVKDASTVLHDICVQNVRFFCKKDIDLEVPIPATAGTLISGSCRGEVFPITPVLDCKVKVICAEERLRADCMAVEITIGFQITLSPPDPLLCPVMVINHFASFTCTRFFPFPSGLPISGNALREALKIIDGSCMVIDELECEVLDGQCSRVRITGKLIDKLWKHDNLWVLAIRPFGGITVKQEFPAPHKIGECTPCPGSPL